MRTEKSPGGAAQSGPATPLLHRQVLDAIRHDRDMSGHVEDAINSLRIVLAADESVLTGQVVAL